MRMRTKNLGASSKRYPRFPLFARLLPFALALTACSSATEGSERSITALSAQQTAAYGIYCATQDPAIASVTNGNVAATAYELCDSYLSNGLCSAWHGGVVHSWNGSTYDRNAMVYTDTNPGSYLAAYDTAIRVCQHTVAPSLADACFDVKCSFVTDLRIP
jgi:hypothetical protein